MEFDDGGGSSPESAAGGGAWERAREIAEEIACDALCLSREHISVAPQWCGDWCLTEEGDCRAALAAGRIAAALADAGAAEVVRDVGEFHRAFGVPLGGSWTNDDRRRLRRALIREEFREYRDAEDADDPCATLDALVDLVYVIVGAALEYGMDFAGAFAAVHAANMAKLGPDGKPILREDGKVLKPDGWRPADLALFVGAALARHAGRALAPREGEGT